MPKESSMGANQNKGCLGVQEGISEQVTSVTQLLCARKGSDTAGKKTSRALTFSPAGKQEEAQGGIPASPGGP